MKVGEVSEPFKTKYGYHVVKLTDKKEDTTDPKQVKEFLKGTLQQEKFNKYVEELKKAAKITKDEKVVENAEKDIKEVEIKSQTSITDKATEGSNTTTENKEKTQENTKKTEDKK